MLLGSCGAVGSEAGTGDVGPDDVALGTASASGAVAAEVVASTFLVPGHRDAFFSGGGEAAGAAGETGLAGGFEPLAVEFEGFDDDSAA